MSTAAHTLKTTGSKHEDRVRMLVLETDQTFEDTAERKGSFGQIFHELFSKAGQKHDPPLEIETLMKFIVEPEGGKLPTAEEVGEVDGVLITGSNYDAHGDDEWILKLIERIRSMYTPKQRK